MLESEQAPGRDEYLAYLKENRLSEADVLPVVDPAARALVELIARVAAEARLTGFAKQLQGGLAANSNDLLSLMNRSIAQRMSARGIQLPAQVFVGVFPTKTLNAHVVRRPPWSLVLVNTGTMEFLEAMLAIFFAMNPGTARDQAKLAAALVQQYCQDQGYTNQRGSPDSHLNLERREAVRHILNATEEFVIAHEYGHLARGHIGDAQANIGSPTAVISVAAKSRQQEFQADLWATNALTTVYSDKTEGDGAALVGCSGPLIFLAAENLIESVFKKQGITNSDTHPEAIERYIELRYAMAKAGLNQASKMGESFHKFCVLVGQELDVKVMLAEGPMAVADHVDALISEGLQEALPLSKQLEPLIFSEIPATVEKPNWWKRWIKGG